MSKLHVVSPQSNDKGVISASFAPAALFPPLFTSGATSIEVGKYQLGEEDSKVRQSSDRNKREICLEAVVSLAW